MVSPAELAIPIDPSADTAPAKKQPLISDDLYTRLTAEDPDAMTDLFHATYSPLTRIAKRILHNPEDAEEVVSDALMSFGKQVLKNPNIKNKPDAYIKVATANKALSRLKTEAKRKKYTLSWEEESSAPGKFFDTLTLPPSIEQQVLVKEELADIAQAIETLPPKQKITIRMAAAGATYSEIGKATESPKGSVSSRLSRARDKVKEVLAASPMTSSENRNDPADEKKSMDSEELAEIKDAVKEIVVFSAA